jgi:hypothetical protein
MHHKLKMAKEKPRLSPGEKKPGIGSLLISSLVYGRSG